MKYSHAFLLFLLPTIGRAAAPEIEFSALMLVSDKPVACLVDQKTKASSWLSHGEKFAGYVVSNIDAATDTVTLTRGDAVYRVKLKAEAKVKNGPAPAPDDIPKAKAEVEQLKARRDELSRRYTEKHPVMLDLAKRLATLEEKLSGNSPAAK
jgi:hypothetical protein